MRLMQLFEIQESEIIAWGRFNIRISLFLRITRRAWCGDVWAARNHVIKAVTVQRTVAIDRRLSHLCYSPLLLAALSRPHCHRLRWCWNNAPRAERDTPRTCVTSPRALTSLSFVHKLPINEVWVFARPGIDRQLIPIFTLFQPPDGKERSLSNNPFMLELDAFSSAFSAVSRFVLNRFIGCNGIKATSD